MGSLFKKLVERISMGSGNGKWAIAFWVLTVLTVGSFTWTTWCYFRNDDKIDCLTQVANHSLTSIDKRLYRIEIACGIEPKAVFYEK